MTHEDISLMSWNRQVLCAGEQADFRDIALILLLFPISPQGHFTPSRLGFLRWPQRLFWPFVTRHRGRSSDAELATTQTT